MHSKLYDQQCFRLRLAVYATLLQMDIGYNSLTQSL